MATTKLPHELTKVSYILPKKAKAKLERAAKSEGVTLSRLISLALVERHTLTQADVMIVPGRRGRPKAA